MQLIDKPFPILADDNVHEALNIRAILKGLIATAAGTAAFVLLTKTQIPVSLISGTSMQLRSCLLVFIAAYFGPLPALITGFAGHAISDALFYGGVWWSWVIADGFCGLAMGIMAYVCRFSAVCLLYIVQVIANVAAWAFLAPLLDVVMYGEDAMMVFYQGLVAAQLNAVLSAVVCTPVSAIRALILRGRGAKPVPMWDCEG